ncbi:sensor histidine kinase [Oxalicibacterium flavum]|uniref:histidine kinase n=1 Tax=Oxalicibacterium flavum TaxID=179467 RepID=A0A8J2UM65_9BURK|nr:sensor histidine kinase [Oxalicibacterium flavum]GGC05652.1 sensor histidine kinase [Oxalicibacterium flavum]
MAQTPVSLDAPKVALQGHLDSWVDSDRTSTIAQVADPAMANRFVPVARGLERGQVGAAVWIRFTVVNRQPADKEWWLEVHPAFLRHIVLYAPDGRGGYAAREDGTSIPFAQREIGYRNPLFKLEIPDGELRTYYMRIDSGVWRTVKLTLWQPTAFLSAVGKEQLLFGLYIGIYMLLTLASLWFERVMRDRVYLCFALYVSGCIFTTLTTTGLWQQYVMPAHPQWFPALFMLSMAFMFGSCIQFFFHFVNMPRSRPRFTRIYLNSVWTFCALAFMFSLTPYGRYAVHLVQLGMVLVIIPASVIVLWRPALRSANEIRLTFIVGGVFLTGSFFYVSLVNYQFLPSTWFSQNAMYISSMTFFLIVFYAVSRRYYAMRLDKELAQHKMLRISHRSEQELEKLVDVRTRELIKAKQSVESALSHAQTVQREQRQFIATVSHELRTPLAVIDATAQNLEREAAAASSKGRARVQKIRQATRRLSLLFDDYLNDERFEQFSHGISPQKIPILPLFEDAVDAAQALSDHHVPHIEVDPGLLLHADPNGLRLILRTLVDNAVKYSPPGSNIVLSARETLGGWHIDIADDGPAIREDERERIFERYYRGRARANRVGTGLGLTLARQFVQQHGGELTLICPPGGGNIFRIFLPVAQV